MKTRFILSSACIALALHAGAYSAQKNIIRVNSDVTTHIIMPENLKLVDISTDKIIGNQCTDNMVRIKPVDPDSIGSGKFRSGEFLGTITMIGERHIAQYDVVYDMQPQNATSIYNVAYDQTEQYTNPEVSMPQSEMARLAWTIYSKKQKFNNIRSRSTGIKAQVYNIYSIGNYFFIDFGLSNKTNIEYDIDEINVSLTDKKETKATNSQTIQLDPVFTLVDRSKFKKYYRQVLVLNKLTFPDEKVLNITVSEKQISGRTITIPIEYSDILNADALDANTPEFTPAQYRIKQAEYTRTRDDYSKILKENIALKRGLEYSESEIGRLKKLNNELTVSFNKMEAAYQGATETINKILSKEK